MWIPERENIFWIWVVEQRLFLWHTKNKKKLNYFYLRVAFAIRNLNKIFDRSRKSVFHLMSNIINEKKLTLYELTSHGSEAFSFGFSSSVLLISSCLLCSCIILSLRRFSLLNCLVISSIWRFNSSQRVSAVSALVVKLNNNKTMDGKYASNITNNYV